MQTMMAKSANFEHSSYMAVLKSIEIIAASQNPSNRARSTQLILDREQFRSEETYSKIREDRKYNAKTAKLAF